MIASSVSNGGAASLRAAEIARPGLIDGVVVSEPNVNPLYDPRFGIQQGGGPVLYRHSRPLYDYLSVVNLYQACANLAQPTAPYLPIAVPADDALEQARCQSLHDAGLLDASDPSAWPAEAQARLNGYGLLPEQNVLAPSYWGFYVHQAVVVTYANAYARAAVTEDLCGYSFAAGLARGADARTLAPGCRGAAVRHRQRHPADRRRRRDQRSLARRAALRPGLDLADLRPRRPERGRRGLPALALARRAAGRRGPQGDRCPTACGSASAWRRSWPSGRLHGTPTIILHGRSDALIAPNHSSRAYYGLNRLRDGGNAPTRYYEVTNAQHLDAFNALPGYSDRFIPLHKYFVDALDLMWAHLTAGAALPPSQVVATTPRAGGAADHGRQRAADRRQPRVRRRSASPATSCVSPTD